MKTQSLLTNSQKLSTAHHFHLTDSTPYAKIRFLQNPYLYFIYA